MTTYKGVNFKAIPEMWIYCDQCYDTMDQWQITPNSPCVQWNADSSIKKPSGEFSLKIIYKHQLDKKFKIYLHDGRENPYLYGDFYEVSSLQNTNIRFTKVLTEKLPAPYKSRCVKEEDAQKYSIFPGRYTVEACKNTRKCIETLKHCGVTFDYCMPYISKDFLKKYYQSNITVFNALQGGCLKRFYHATDAHQCYEPCSKVEFRVDWMMPTPVDPGQKAVTVTFKQSQREAYVVRKERPLVKFEDLFGIVGGTIGLFCGFSILSLIELLSFLTLKIASCCKLRKTK